MQTVFTAVSRAGFLAVVSAALLSPSRAEAQDSAAAQPQPPAGTSTAIRPGMTEADVRARWGDPVATKRANEWTYLFFRNYDEYNVGYYDVVFLQNGQVVDAVVRNPEHVYQGQSSSPPTRAPEMTPPQARPEGSAAGAVTGVRVTP